MTGYQETLTDPSYHRQVVVQTAPHIGNTGVNDEDDESRRIWVAGYVVRDPARRASSWRARRTLDDELAAQGIVGISGIDTRALTRHLRERGAMRCGVSSTDLDRRCAAATGCSASPPMVGADLSAEVTTPRAVHASTRSASTRFTVAALDYGIKSMTPHRMAERGITTHVLPSTSTADDVLATGADAVFLANGPGDPATADARGGHRARVAGRAGADVRHLLRQPDPRPRVRVRHLQARLRPPRASTSRCRTGAPARSRSPRTTTASPSTRRSTRATDTEFGARRGQPRLPQRRRRRGACAPATCRRSACSTTPRRRPARTTPRTCSTGSSNCSRRAETLMPQGARTSSTSW